MSVIDQMFLYFCLILSKKIQSTSANEIPSQDKGLPLAHRRVLSETALAASPIPRPPRALPFDGVPRRGVDLRPRGLDIQRQSVHRSPPVVHIATDQVFLGKVLGGGEVVRARGAEQGDGENGGEWW